MMRRIITMLSLAAALAIPLTAFAGSNGQTPCDCPNCPHAGHAPHTGR